VKSAAHQQKAAMEAHATPLGAQMAE